MTEDESEMLAPNSIPVLSSSKRASVSRSQGHILVTLNTFLTVHVLRKMKTSS
jgi:hypothetical protein